MIKEKINKNQFETKTNFSFLTWKWRKTVFFNKLIFLLLFDFYLFFPYSQQNLQFFTILHFDLTTEKPSHFMGFLYIFTLFQKFEMYKSFKLIFSYFSLNRLEIYNNFHILRFDFLTLKPTEEWVKHKKSAPNFMKFWFWGSKYTRIS